MNIDMNVVTNRFTGTQKIEYWNNSPDTLWQVFYHLFYNAFQPGSMMETRDRRQAGILLGYDRDGKELSDKDTRIKDISKLNPDEIGYQKIISMKLNGRPQKYKVMETILEVTPDKPILPRSKVVFDVQFEAQVPLIIRRTGRDQPVTKVRYSMAQWYPKICAYDQEGWHPTPFIGREFYGVWGDFDVSISIDKRYMLGGTGYLQNPNQVGFGYETPGTKVITPPGEKLTWRFLAPNVHDFMWAADPDFIHRTKKIKDSLTLHLLYKATNATAEQWEGVLNRAEKMWPYIEKAFGAYPYKQFSFIHGGDGGTEYPMGTLLLRYTSAMHELMHAWFYGMVANNENKYSWMDEGFASFAEHKIRAIVDSSKGFPFSGAYDSYGRLVKSEKEEPMSTEANYFNTNFAYQQSSYTKGEVFLVQLGYITGRSTLDKILYEYCRQWRFKHPNPADFMRVAEKVSKMKLDWYYENWIHSIKTIDYKIDSLWEEGGKTNVRIRNIGMIPMPIDVQLTFKDSTKELHYIPLDLMYGEKQAEDSTLPRNVYNAWKWTEPTFIISTKRRLGDFKVVEIDPSLRMADIDRKNNRLEIKWN